MTYSADWFRNNGEQWIKFLGKFIGASTLNFLEIGCFEGRATVWLLENILTGKRVNIDVIDTFDGNMEYGERGDEYFPSVAENFNKNIAGHEDKVGVYTGLSFDILTAFCAAGIKYDFVYIDGSHRSREVLEDSVLAFSLLRVGGIIIWDDYGWHKKEPKLCPKMAIDAFLSIYEGKYKMIHKGYQVCIEKIAH